MTTNTDLPAAKSKIQMCEKVTSAVSEATRRAANILLEGSDGRIMVNFFGVFAEPHKRRAELQTAIETINKAILLLDGAPWPSASDYDEL